MSLDAALVLDAGSFTTASARSMALFSCGGAAFKNASSTSKMQVV